jgi:acyl-coenzyme A synthetase/AMP-(fatty) acid ligase
MEFFGRLDHQVKVRGFRIEAGEIEARLLEYPSVKEAVVPAREDENGDNYLCAYIVPRDKAVEGFAPGLKKYLSQLLPDYMVPSYFVFMEKIPLTPAGKIDRSALPPPGFKAETVSYEAPSGVVEREMAEIWGQVLGRA